MKSISLGIFSLLFNFLACFVVNNSSTQNYNFDANQHRIHRDLSEADIKFMYYETLLQTLLYGNDLVPYQIMVLEFYENKSRYSKRDDVPSLIISDKHTNKYIRYFNDLKELEDSLIIPTEHIVSNMDFYFQTPIIKQHIPEMIDDQQLPGNAIAYIELSDIIKKTDRLYYISVYLFYLFSDDDYGISTSDAVITLEFEKCKSGLIMPNRKIYGRGNEIYFHGRDGKIYDHSISNLNRYKCD
jgi:hypothetical protein